MDIPYTLSTSEIETRSFISRVYAWMCGGLALTGWTAWMIGNSPVMINYLMTHKVLFYGILIGEFVLVIGLAGWVKSMTAAAATMAFLFYAFFNGITFSVIFLLYTKASIGSAFLITAGTFGAMSFYGYVTKRDLTSIGNICLMGLIGIILASIVNIFMRNSMMDTIVTYVGILIFVGLTAYDTQRIKNMNIIGNDGTDEDRKEAIMGALTLYLDFINLFLKILRATGRRR